MPPYDPKAHNRSGYAARTGQVTAEAASEWAASTPVSSALRQVRAAGKVNPHVLDALAGQAEQLEQRSTTAGLHVRESLTYERGSTRSFFQDLLSVASSRSSNATEGAQQRLAQHQREMNRIMPPWREARRRLADAAYEAAFASDWRGQQALDRMERLGIKRFTPGSITERRAANTTAGTGGNFVPPLWITTEFVDAPRAGAPLAGMVTRLPVALHTGDTINVPRWATGIGGGTDVEGGPVPESAAADSFSTSKIVTIAGQQSVSSFWADQAAPPGSDLFVFRDLLEDMANSTEAQILIGAGAGGQLAGIIPGGVAAAASMVWSKSTNNTSSQTWTVSSADTPLWSAVPTLFALMAKARGRYPTLLVVSPATWAQISGLLDSTGRPLVLPCADPPQPGQVVQIWGLPALIDATLPDTFGGTTPPAVTTDGGVTAVLAGTGTWSVIAAVREADLVLFDGEIQTAVLQDVLSGTLQYRFTASTYAGFLRDRYTAAAALSASNSADLSGAVSAGGSTVCGLFSNYVSTSPMQPVAAGFAG